MAVRSTRIELWSSDPQIAIGDFEFLRQNLSLSRVQQFWSSDLADFLADISSISADIRVIMVKNWALYHTLHL